LKSTQVTCHCQVKSSQVECDQVDGGRLGVDFSFKSGHVSVPQRLAGLDLSEILGFIVSCNLTFIHLIDFITAIVFKPIVNT